MKKTILSTIGTVAIIVLVKVLFFQPKYDPPYPMLPPQQHLATAGSAMIYEDALPCFYTSDSATLDGKRIVVRIPCTSKKTSINPDNDICAFMKPVDTGAFQIIEVSQDVLNKGITHEKVISTLLSKNYRLTVGGVDSVKRVSINDMPGVCMFKRDNQSTQGEAIYYHYLIFMLIYHDNLLTFKYCVGTRKRDQLYADIYFRKLEPIWNEMIKETSFK